MSRYTRRTENHELQFGYDEPLDWYFAVITSADGVEMFFSNLERDNPAMTVDEVQAKLAEYGYELSEAEYTRLVNDRTRGNSDVPPIQPVRSSGSCVDQLPHKHPRWWTKHSWHGNK